MAKDIEPLKVEILEMLHQFTDNGITYGIYKVSVNSQTEIVVRNDKSIAVLWFCLGEDAIGCMRAPTQKFALGVLKALESRDG